MLSATATYAGQPAPLHLHLRDVPAHGLVLARVHLPARAPGSRQGERRFHATLSDGSRLAVQFVADSSSGSGHDSGLLALRLPRGGDADLQLVADDSVPPAARKSDAEVLAETPFLGFLSGKNGGMPVSLTFPASGRRLTDFAWNDRLYDSKRGSFFLRFDPASRTEVLSDGPVCTVIRTHAHYAAEDGKTPESHPSAEYDWFLFKGTPAVYVRASIRQEASLSWPELHFLEFNVKGADFRRYAGGDPPQQGDLTAGSKSVRFETWGALVDGRDALGMFGTPVTLYDGRGNYGTYLHSTWTSWGDREFRTGAWLWAANADDPAAAIREAAEHTGNTVATLTSPELDRRIAAVWSVRESPLKRAVLQLRAAVATRLEAEGRWSLAEAFLGAAPPNNWELQRAGDLGLALEQLPHGIRLGSLADLKTKTELLALDTLPLFSLALRDTESRESVTLTADAGWKKTHLEPTTNMADSSPRASLVLRWEEPADPRLKGIQVTATATAQPRSHAWCWSLHVRNETSRWSIMRADFPQVSAAEPGKDAVVLFPRGSGELQSGVWRRPFSYEGSYPSGWCSMQVMAVYGGGSRPTGLYFAMHDPTGSTKNLTVESSPAERGVRMVYEHPVPNMGRSGNDFTLSGQAVWQLLRGDWFDAATIYKTWAKREAKWQPKLGPGGREDTPLWMRELPVWTIANGAPSECVGPVKEFARYLGVPTGFHWYNWHQNPFDNDYPHYFPTKPGVAEGVRELQQAGVRVMPYINGRLWDTRDRGAEDFEFTSKALPAVTKDENGKPITESYGSKEADGTPVVLGVMCPTTQLWQHTQRDIVLRLMNEVGVDGVYMDQIAAAAPALCMDPTHGHPLGGGSWWAEGYWKLLSAIRKAKPADRIMTTECNSEPFLHRFDGYLTWHWQFDGQVPFFPAVYGGAVQMFGRNYAGGPTAALALRMKSAQQLTFGEQIGWLDPSVVKQPENAAFLREVVRLRYRFRRFFYAGEMARPPHLLGKMPTVRADWQWSGEWWVTTDAVLTGAWRLPAEKKAVLFFVNVGDKPVTSECRFDAAAYGLAAAHVKVTKHLGSDGAPQTESVPHSGLVKITVPARTSVVWEFGSE